MHIVFQEYASSDAEGLLQNALERIHVINRILDEDFKYITNITYAPPPPPEYLSNSTFLNVANQINWKENWIPTVFAVW